MNQEIATLKAALAKAIFRTTLTRRWKDENCDDDEFLVDWTDEVKEWAALAGVDLSKYDPMAYHR